MESLEAARCSQELLTPRLFSCWVSLKDAILASVPAQPAVRSFGKRLRARPHQDAAVRGRLRLQYDCAHQDHFRPTDLDRACDRVPRCLRHRPARPLLQVIGSNTAADKHIDENCGDVDFWIFEGCCFCQTTVGGPIARVTTVMSISGARKVSATPTA